ncbi:uncharacterized protein LDX57_012992 [Aspergillus melleus]|uniref:uncharacterized protein n=1 Tax=Aspergillus melleus TaxID=138277 RepID=UPI001E8CC2CC|nr:uncharacterized protein LDX57_012992 [Aspergillus melleus]KAH8435363.1 hypothetical protein LDX57_012992 [Aspergillus melleus]
MTNTRKPTVLTDLPLELLLMISDHLSVVDIACLALCNHHLMASLIEMKSAFDRFSSSRAVDLNDAVRIEFMSRLALDMPPYYPCFGCLRLHPWRNISLPRPYFNLPGCFKTLYDSGSYINRTRAMELDNYPSYTTCEIHFVHLQLAMRRFYYGPQFGIPAESFSSTEVAVHPLETGTMYPMSILPASAGPLLNKDIDNNAMITLTSIEARICPDPPGLCVRTQELAVMRRHKVLRVPPRHSVYMRICGHISTSRSNFWEIFDPLLEQYCSDSTTMHVGDQGRCAKCNTSWKLELRDVGSRDVCLVLTKWMDLGPGLSPEDARWKSHISTVSRILLADDELVSDPQARFERDSAQANEANALSDEEMFNRNISLLQRHEYLNSMIRVGNYSRWFLNAELAQERGQTKRRGISRCVVI